VPNRGSTEPGGEKVVVAAEHEVEIRGYRQRFAGSLPLIDAVMERE
jgi:hypothetical protein